MDNTPQQTPNPSKEKRLQPFPSAHAPEEGAANGVHPAVQAELDTLPAQAPVVAPTPQPQPYVADLQQYTVGSQMPAPKRSRVPIGIYIIGIYYIVGTVISIVTNQSAGSVYAILNYVDLVIGLALVLRLEFARLVAAAFAGLSILAMILLLIGGHVTRNRYNDLKSRYDQAISSIPESRLTSVQKSQIKTLNAQVADQKKEIDATFKTLYLRATFEIVGSLAIIVYLTRPKVKDAFGEHA